MIRLLRKRIKPLHNVDHRKTELVTQAVSNLLQPLYEAHILSHEIISQSFMMNRIAKELDIDFFFAQPYTAWEWGDNENMNGPVRKNITKNRDLYSVTNHQTDQILVKLDYRPR